MSVEMVDLARREDPDAVRPRPASDELDNEFGVSQDLPFSTSFIDPTARRGRFSNDTSEVLPDLDEGPTVRQLVAMRRMDGQARALYRLITLPIRSALDNCSFIPQDNGGEKEAEFIDQMFKLPPNAGGMSVTFHRVMAQMLMGVFDGFAAFEQVYWVPKKGPLKGKITLKKLAHRPAETITFLADKHGGFAGLRQRASFNGQSIDVAIPAADALYYACNEEERPFYGVSYFQSAFYHYDKKVRLYYVAHLAAQRAAVGTRKGTMPKNASTKDKSNFIKALADLGVAQHITLPGPDWDVEILKEGGNFDFLSYINHHNSQMSKSVLASFFDMAQGGGAADTSLVNFGQQSDALFMLMLKTIMDEIAAVINHYVIPKFIDWNFGTGKYPKFVWGTFTDEQKAAINQTFRDLATAGQSMNVTQEFMFVLEKHMADEMGLEIDYEAIEAERERQAEMAKLQEEADRAALEEALAGGGDPAAGDGAGGTGEMSPGDTTNGGAGAPGGDTGGGYMPSGSSGAPAEA